MHTNEALYLTNKVCHIKTDMLVFMWQLLFGKYKDLFVCMTRHFHVANSKLPHKNCSCKRAFTEKKNGIAQKFYMENKIVLHVNFFMENKLVFCT